MFARLCISFNENKKGERDNTNTCKLFVVCYTILFEKKIELSLELNMWLFLNLDQFT